MSLIVFFFVEINRRIADQNGQETKSVKDPVKCYLLLVLERAKYRALFGEDQNRLKQAAYIADCHEKRMPREQARSGLTKVGYNSYESQ